MKINHLGLTHCRLGGMLFSPKEETEEQSKHKSTPEDEAASSRKSRRDLRKLVRFSVT